MLANPGHNPGETGNGADVPKPANDDNKNTPENNGQDNPVDPVQTPDVPAHNEETVAKVENGIANPDGVISDAKPNVEDVPIPKPVNNDEKHSWNSFQKLCEQWAGQYWC